MVAVSLLLAPATAASSSATTQDRHATQAEVPGSADEENRRALFEPVRILSIDPGEGTAAFLDEDGTVRVIERRETLPGTTARVVDLLHDRLVVEISVASEQGPVEKHRAWVYLARGQETSQIRFLRRKAPPQPRSSPRPSSIRPESESVEESPWVVLRSSQEETQESLRDKVLRDHPEGEPPP